MHPDSLTWGWLQCALPPVLLWSMAYPQKPARETQLHNPKRLGINTYGALRFCGMGDPFPFTMQAGSSESRAF